MTQPQRTDDSPDATTLGGCLYWLLWDSLMFWAVLVGLPVIAMWSLYNNHPTAAIVVGACALALVMLVWFVRRRR